MTELLEIQVRILDVTNIYGEEFPLITLDVEASDTIAIVKTKFYLKTKTEPEEGEQLYFGIQLLEDDHTLSDYNMKQGYTLIAYGEESGGDGVPDSLYFCMEGHPEMATNQEWISSSTVETLKDMISYESKEGRMGGWDGWEDYNLDELQMECNNIQLEAGYTLSDYNIQPGHVIVCKPKD